MMPPKEQDTAAFPGTGALLDRDATEAWELAAWIGQATDDNPLRSFTTVLIALLYAPNTLSRWFGRYVRVAGWALGDLYETKSFRPAMLAQIATMRATGELSPDRERFTQSLMQIADAAESLRNSTDAEALGVRHLLGAYVYHPGGHADQLAQWGFNRQRDGSAFLRQIRVLHPSELDAWTRVHEATSKTPPDLDGHDPLPKATISNFAADSADGVDQLNIEDDVYALSALVCSCRVSPPLSIGIFGEWGSGKSFFIRQMQRGVAAISAEARATDQLQKTLSFYKYVVQIEFNAWNYSAGNLWAALVQHILENLRFLVEAKDDDLVAKRRGHLQAQMELESKVKESARLKRDEARKKVMRLDRELDDLRTRHSTNVAALRDVMATDVLAAVDLDPVKQQLLTAMREKLDLPAAGNTLGDFIAAVASTRSVLTRASAVFKTVPDPDKVDFAAKSIVVLAAPPLLAMAVALLLRFVTDTTWASISALAAWLSATLGFATKWLSARAAQIDTQLAKVEELQAYATKRVDKEEADHRAQAASLEQRIALAKEEILATQAEQRNAQAEYDRIAAQLAATTPGTVLADFLRERADSDDYRKHLGLPAIIRRDFERISTMIAQENKAVDEAKSKEAEDNGKDRRINRIVLYIDDLDRCPEDRVVEVLKAVHLLLAFPLFVVVVAVDARWVSRSLARRFPGLLSAHGDNGDNGDSPPAVGEGHATTSDYLEKIFQIPFWLRRPTEPDVRNMLKGLFAATVGAGGGRTSDAGGPLRASAEAVPVFRRRLHESDAVTLDITLDEQKFAEALVPLLDRSPRSLKRFVNVFRLLKASLPPDELDAFHGGGGLAVAPFMSALLLLAIVNGLPDVADALVVSARAAAPGATRKSLGTLVAELPVAGPGLDERRRLTTWLESAAGGVMKEADAAVVVASLPRVARYSYRLHEAALA